MQRRTRRIVNSVFLAGVVLLLGLHFWFPPIDPGTPRTSYSTTAGGKKAVYRLAEELDFEVSRNHNGLRVLSANLSERFRPTAILILGPERYPSEEEWSALLDYAESGGTVVFAVRDDEFSDPEDVMTIPGLDVRVKPVEDEIDDPAADIGDTRGGYVATSLLSDPDLYWQTQSQLSVPDGETLVAFDGTVQASSMTYGKGRVVFVASDFIFSNQSIAYGDNSVLTIRLLESAGADVIYFDESLNSPPKVMGLFLEPFLRPLTIHLLMLLWLFAWWRFWRFGPVLPRVVKERHNIVDHTDAVGTLYYRTGDGTGALKPYLNHLVAELRLPMHKGKEDRVLDPISRRMDVKTESIKKLFHRATLAAKSDNVNRQTASEFIRRLSKVRRAASRPQHSNGRPNADGDSTAQQPSDSESVAV